MKIPHPAINPALIKTLKNPFLYIRAISLALVLLLTAYTCYFLYSNFYLSIIHAQEVVILESDVIHKDIDIPEFEQIRRIHTYKTSKLLPRTLPNPFSARNIPAAE